jgi:hypothetical protein
LSIDYGKHVSDGQSHVFSLKFDPAEVEQALHIPLDRVTIESNTWYPGLFASTPAQVVCFPYAQHFVTDSYADSQSTIMNRSELEQQVNALGDLSQWSGFSAKPIKRQLLIGMLLSATLTTTALITLLIVFVYR